jgi:hypothetical protein
MMREIALCAIIEKETFVARKGMLMIVLNSSAGIIAATVMGASILICAVLATALVFANRRNR